MATKKKVLDCQSGECEEDYTPLVLFRSLENRFNLFEEDVIVRLSDLEGNMTDITTDISGIHGTIASITGEVNTLKITSQEMSGKLTTLEGDFAQLSLTVDGFSTQIGDIEGNISSITQDLTSVTQRVTTAEGNISTLTTSVNGISGRVEDVEGNFADLQINLNGLTTTVSQQGIGLSQVQQTVEGLSTTVEDVDGRLSSLNITVNGFSGRISDTEGNITTIQGTINGWSSTVEKSGIIVSQILQEDDTILIKANQIELEGLVTANENFKILEDGSIEAQNGTFIGTIESNSAGDRIIIDPEERALKLKSYDNLDVVKIATYEEDGAYFPAIRLSFYDNGVIGDWSYLTNRSLNFHTNDILKGTEIGSDYITTYEGNSIFHVRGRTSRLEIQLRNLPTSAASAESGYVYLDGETLKLKA